MFRHAEVLEPVLCCTWGCFHLGTAPTIHFAVFSPRLYLLPVALAAFVLDLWSPRVAMAIVLAPALVGGVEEYRAYRRFQESYRTMDRLASQRAPEPLYTSTSIPPAGSEEIVDPQTGLHLGDYRTRGSSCRRKMARCRRRQVPQNGGLPRRGVLVFAMEPSTYRPFALRVGGAVDTVERAGVDVVISGWVPFPDGDEHQRLFVAVPERVVSWTAAAVPRPDVVAAESKAAPLTLLASANPACRALSVSEETVVDRTHRGDSP